MKPNGRLEFYEVLVKQMRIDEVVRQRKSIIMGDETSCVFQEPTCIGAEYLTIVEVRAVNADSIVLEVPEEMLNHHAEDYNYDENYYNDNDDLICEGSRQTEYKSEKIKRYFNNSLYHLYKSPWQTSARYSCSTSRLSRITTIALVVGLLSLGVMGAFYMARKKYNKMANINCTLPPGLESYFTKDNNGFPATEFGNNIICTGEHAKSLEIATREAEDQWISAARNFRNEHHHLLASLGNDSGYLGGGGINVNGHILSSSLETANNSENSEEKLRDNEIEDYEEDYEKENLSSSVDSLVESCDALETRNQSVNEEAPLSIFPNDNGYIKQSMLQPWQNFTERNNAEENKALNINYNNGYISPQSLHTAENPTPAQNSGYILQEDIQKFFHNSQAQPPVIPFIAANTTAQPTKINETPTQFNSGYTTLEDLAKLNINQPIITPSNEENSPIERGLKSNVTTNAAPTQPPSGADGGGGGLISGYVTQQDLNLFAQHQQH